MIPHISQKFKNLNKGFSPQKFCPRVIPHIARPEWCMLWYDNMTLWPMRGANHGSHLQSKIRSTSSIDCGEDVGWRILPSDGVMTKFQSVTKTAKEIVAALSWKPSGTSIVQQVDANLHPRTGSHATGNTTHGKVTACCLAASFAQANKGGYFQGEGAYMRLQVGTVSQSLPFASMKPALAQKERVSCANSLSKLRFCRSFPRNQTV